MVNGIRKIDKDVRRILTWLFVLLMAAQILLGFGWMIANMGYLSLFQETSLIVKASEKLVIDEYMGMLYPLLIIVTKWIAKVVPVPYYTLLYIVQLSVAAFAVVYMLKHCNRIKGDRHMSKIVVAFLTGYMLTFPLLLQMHMAVLPYSLAMSVTIILICDGLYCLRNIDKICGRALIRLCGLWILDALFLPEYSWILGIFVLGVFTKILLKNKAWRLRMLVSLLSTVLCFGVIGTTTQTPGSMDRIQKSVGASLLSRFVWPNFISYSYFWPEQITDALDAEELSHISKYPEGVIFNFGPVMEEEYGREAANDIYWEMALTSLELNTRQILIDISRDFAAYLCPPAAVQIQSVENHSSLLAWNYGRLQDEAPVLTKYYVNISIAGWNVMAILGLLMILLKMRTGKFSYSHLLLVISVVFMAFWYTMQGAGVQDYKKVMLISFLWLLPVIKGFLLTEENMERDEDKKNE